MSATGVESQDVSRENAQLGYTMAALLVLSLLTAFGFFYIVPKFQQIFDDTMPGKPLPEITLFVLTFRVGLACLALGWPIAAAMFWKWEKPLALAWMNVGVFWFLIEMAIVAFALFMPMVSTMSGMSSSR